MNCKQCGAPMTVEDGKNFFYCDYCGSYDFPDPNLDGVALLNEPSPYSCPICNKPLVTASIGSIHIFSCPVCRGNFIDQSKMLAILRQASSPDGSDEEQYHHLNGDELQRKAICPVCQQIMDSYQYGGPGNIVIQGCRHCEMIWLDFGEIARVLHSFAEMYGRPPAEPGQKTQSIEF